MIPTEETNEAQPTQQDLLESMSPQVAEALHATHNPGLSLHHIPIGGTAEFSATPWNKGIRGNEDYRGNIQAIQNSATPMSDLAAQAILSHNDNIANGASQMFSHLDNEEKISHQQVIGDPISDWVPDSKGMTQEKKLKAMQNAIVQPEAMVANKLGDLTESLQKEGLPGVAQAYSDHQSNLYKVLGAITPPDSESENLNNPWLAQQKQGTSEAQMTSYQRSLAVLADPTKLYDLVKSNTLMPKDVALVAAAHPETLQKMREATVQSVMDDKPNLSLQHRLSLGYLMGQPIDPSMSIIPQLQAVFPAPRPAIMPGKRTAKGSTDTAKKQDTDIADGTLTTSQKALRNV